MKNLQLCAFSIFFVITLAIVACNGQSTTNAPTTPMPTTAPLSAVEKAILAANEKDYDKANQLLDISAVAQSSNFESVAEYWDWITSGQRVSTIDIKEEETKGETKRLFITLQNDNYPTRNVGFWIRWQDDRWVAFDDNG
ncbi:MAG: hypothetical protein AB1801_14510 [Chloroflexota bacterium]